MHFDDSCTVANTVPLLLNNSAFKIKHTEGEERGVYGTRIIFLEKYTIGCHFVSQLQNH